MNREILHQSANSWVAQAKADISNKIREFTRESGISLHEMANDLGLDINELNNIMNGGVPSLKTFAILMLAAGYVLEIKSLREAGIPTDGHGLPIPQGQMPIGMPWEDEFKDDAFDDEDNDDDEDEDSGICGNFEPIQMPEPPVCQQPRAANGRFKPWPRPEAPAPRQPRHHVPTPFGVNQAGRHPRPPFSTMSREELIHIVQEHLWQDEIDLANVDHSQLVRFLEEKDRQFNERRAAKENGGRAVAIDPSVVQLKEKLKKSLDKNPHLRGYLKDLFDE